MYTPTEKAAGRAFRDRSQAALTALCVADPTEYTVPNVLAVLRHACPARGGRSSCLELKEIYRYSPATATVGAGRFGFIYRQGRCRGCGQAARSPIGRLVDGQTRGPLNPRAARSETA